MMTPTEKLEKVILDGAAAHDERRKALLLIVRGGEWPAGARSHSGASLTWEVGGKVAAILDPPVLYLYPPEGSGWMSTANTAPEMAAALRAHLSAFAVACEPCGGSGLAPDTDPASPAPCLSCKGQGVAP